MKCNKTNRFTASEINFEENIQLVKIGMLFDEEISYLLCGKLLFEEAHSGIFLYPLPGRKFLLNLDCP